MARQGKGADRGCQFICPGAARRAALEVCLETSPLPPAEFAVSEKDEIFIVGMF
jgi:hypothetical protein